MNHHGPSDVDGVLKQMANRTQAGRAVSLIGCFGLPGSGKSEGAILLGSKLQQLMGGSAVESKDLLAQLRFKPRDFPGMAQLAGPLKSVFCDEGSGEGGNRMRQMGSNNVDVAIDLDACRGRRQPIFWCNPFRRDLTPQVAKHMAWAVEFNLDHTATFWEAEPVDPMFGREPFFHDRFTVEPKFPWLGDYLPEVRKFYLGLKDDHMAGKDPFTLRQQATVGRFLPAIARVLG